MLKERSRLESVVGEFNQLLTDLHDCTDLLDLAQTEEDLSVLDDLSSQLVSLKSKIELVETTTLLSDPLDGSNVYVSFAPGEMRGDFSM